MPPSLLWSVRGSLGPRARRRVRVAVDLVAAGALGSIGGARSSHQVAITLDDGPDPDVTPAVLDVLERLRVSCTFFLLVQQCRQLPELAREVTRRGHEVGLHGLDHRRITGVPYREAVDYLVAARDELQDLAQQEVVYYRPPYGSQSPTSYLAARRAGLNVVVWSADVEDWVDRPVEDVVAKGLARLGPGGILLAHERLEPDPLRGAPTTTFDRASMVERLIEESRARGLAPTTVGDLLARGCPRRTAWFRP